MVKQQHIAKKKPKKSATVVDARTPKPLVVDPAIANKPVRSVNFVEVGDMDRKQVQLMIQELNKIHDTAKGGIHYFVPVRGGKITSDVVFENEWLDVVKKTCEVRDGEITLKGGATDVHVVRQQL